MIEDFLNALQNFTRQKLRTLLSLLGIIIGVASVIVITSIIASSTEEIKRSFGSYGLDMLQVQGGFMKRKKKGVTIKIDDTFRENLFNSIEDIKHIWYKNSLSSTLSYKETESNSSCEAVETGYLEAYGVELQEGRFFNVTEDYKGVQVIILGKTIAEALFPAKDAIGKSVLVTTSKVSFSFKVVGVLKEAAQGFENSDNTAYITRGFYMKKIDPSRTASTMMIQAVSPAAASILVDRVQEYCDNLSGSEYSVWIMSMQKMIDQIGEMQDKMGVLLGAIAAISLLVGGVGIMNIMIVTVTERKKEIGIRKALGASRTDITRQFLVESASITLIGGVIGVVIGSFISLLVEHLKGQPYLLSANSCIISFVFSIAVGVFFGLNPARRAAKLEAVTALQSE